MSAIDRLRKVITDQGDNFKEQLSYWTHRCFFVCNPLAVLVVEPMALPDGRKAWLVRAAAGDMNLFASMLPFWREWIAFQRAKPEGKECAPMKVYPADRLLRRISK